MDYKLIEKAIFKAWLKATGVVLVVYAAIMAVWLKWSAIRDWVSEKTGLFKKEESYPDLDFSWLNN